MKREEALAAILTERRRQIDEEGWTPDHDTRAHKGGELALAAACYVADRPIYLMSLYGVVDGTCEVQARKVQFEDPWPFRGTTELAKSNKDRQRQLVVAAALILAELERLDGASVDQG